MGPTMQYAEEKIDPIEIRIYPGADGEFTLYEDENNNYNYEKGMYSIITFSWNEAKKILIISNRYGSFHGMHPERTFNIVRITTNTGAGMNIVEKYDKRIRYTGKKVAVKL